jgi:hypothetical protein
MTFTQMSILPCLLLAGLACAPAAAETANPKLLQYDIAGLIRFDSAQGAEARRAELIHFIWPGGLPATRPTVTDVPKDCPELSAVESDLVSHVRRLDVNVSGFDFHSLVFVAYPRSPAKTGAMLAIVHPGHMQAGVDQYLAAGTGDAVNTLLRKGFIVAVVQMPLACWNIDADGKLPSGQVFKIKKRNTGGHNELFKTLEPELHGGTMRFFLEPVVQTINELLAEESDSRGLLMTGLSGGGWTTHLATAVDVRIDTSIPVAGSLPLYARPFSPGSDGDMEQHYPALYRETDSDGDGVLDKATGVCSWLEIYALGASTPSRVRPRHVIQVLNLNDTCCFGGTVYKSYASQLEKRVDAIGTGTWQIFSDESHRGHAISPFAIEKVLLPAIERMQIKPGRSNGRKPEPRTINLYRTDSGTEPLANCEKPRNLCDVVSVLISHVFCLPQRLYVIDWQ